MTTPMNEEQMQTWVRSQYQTANGYLAERGLVTDRVLTKESRMLVPHVTVWKFSLQRLTEKVWVIAGADLPTDHIDASLAETAQDALRYFSYMWQLKADKILANESGASQEQQTIADVLIQSAERIFQMSEEKQLWGEEA